MQYKMFTLVKVKQQETTVSVHSEVSTKGEVAQPLEKAE